MKILGIETSCDETAASVVEDGRHALSDVVASQIDIHRRWGGVVPELASRNHVVQVMPVIDEALTRAGCTFADLDAIAVTAGPGLVGALLVGLEVAKTLAWTTKLPLVPVNHLEGHLLAARLLPEAPEPPFLGLVVSGGHTSLYEVKALGNYRRLATTRDDAAGEAYDKTARLLGLPYPGGRPIDDLARVEIRSDPFSPRASRRQRVGLVVLGAEDLRATTCRETRCADRSGAGGFVCLVSGSGRGQPDAQAHHCSTHPVDQPIGALRRCCGQFSSALLGARASHRARTAALPPRRPPCAPTTAR